MISDNNRYVGVDTILTLAAQFFIKDFRSFNYFHDVEVSPHQTV